jgi:hypothetical protein
MASVLSASADAHAGFSKNLDFRVMDVPSFLTAATGGARDSPPV